MMIKLKSLPEELGEFYPLPILLLVFVPFLIGFIINPEQANYKDILVNLLWIPVFTIPYLLLRKKFIYRLVACIYFIVGLIEICHWILLKGPLTLTSMVVVSNTNIQEAKEFLQLTASLQLLLVIPYIWLFYWIIRHPREPKTSKIQPYLMGVLLLTLLLFSFENIIHGRFFRQGTPSMIEVPYSFISQRKLLKDTMQEKFPRKVDAFSERRDQKETYIIILGESCSRRHMSLYANIRNTNPKLSVRNDIVVYNDVISPYSNTIGSVLTMFSNSNLEHEMSPEFRIDLLDVFHSAGFKTYWISNQSPVGIWDNLVTQLAEKSDYIKFVNTTGNTSLEASEKRSYDAKLFRPFYSTLREDVPKKFIVLHMMGSHAYYSKRYPSEYNVFKGAGHKDKTIAKFDNSVLYNDFIVDSLLNMISIDTNHIASAIYLSDHGENVYDESGRVGHSYSGVLPKANVEIPFVVWLSKAYMKHNPEKTSIARLNCNMPYVTDDLFHSVIDLAGIHTDYLEESRSLFSEKYNASRRRILEDGNDYDNLPKGH